METKPNFFEKFWYIFVGLAIILILALGSLWFLNQKTIKEQRALQQLEAEKAANQAAIIDSTTENQVPAETDTQILQLENQGSSDEVEEIENDLNNTDFSNIDQETASIDSELDIL
jgi:hypothetical protein